MALVLSLLAWRKIFKQTRKVVVHIEGWFAEFRIWNLWTVHCENSSVLLNLLYLLNLYNKAKILMLCLRKILAWKRTRMPLWKILTLFFEKASWYRNRNNFNWRSTHYLVRVNQKNWCQTIQNNSFKEPRLY